MSIDGIKQEVVSVKDTEAIFKILEVNDYQLSNFKVYFKEGIPNGLSVLESLNLELEPQFEGGSSDFLALGSSSG